MVIAATSPASRMPSANSVAPVRPISGCKAVARHSLNLDFASGRLFYGVSLVSTALAAGIVLIPGAPLLAMTLTVNVIATLLMAPALLLLLLLASDREIMGDLANGLLANVVGGAVAAAVALMGVGYGIITVFPNLIGK